jgi:hypothetical protein
MTNTPSLQTPDEMPCKMVIFSDSRVFPNPFPCVEDRNAKLKTTTPLYPSTFLLNM